MIHIPLQAYTQYVTWETCLNCKYSSFSLNYVNTSCLGKSYGEMHLSRGHPSIHDPSIPLVVQSLLDTQKSRLTHRHGPMILLCRLHIPREQPVKWTEVSASKAVIKSVLKMHIFQLHLAAIELMWSGLKRLSILTLLWTGCMSGLECLFNFSFVSL